MLGPCSLSLCGAEGPCCCIAGECGRLLLLALEEPLLHAGQAVRRAAWGVWGWNATRMPCSIGCCAECMGGRGG